jgi:ArsR family transcriptional regulator, arsenate/arsenite/antimonite-responsive transcriptional repressor
MRSTIARITSSVVSMSIDTLARCIDACQYDQVKLLQEIDPCCAPLLSTPLAEDDAESLARALQVLADPARLRLLSLIATCPESEACGCDLMAPLGLSQPTVSYHLNVLHEAGLLERERRGKWVYFRARPESLAPLRSVLSA